MTSDVPEKSSRTLSTVSTTIRVIDALKSLQGATATDLMAELDLSKAAVYNHLTTLRENNYVIKDGPTYRLSPLFITLGEFVRSEDTLYTFGREEVDRLVEETGEYAQLVTELHGKGVIIYKSEGENAVGSEYLTAVQQNRFHLHYTAAGKAILAHLSEARVEEIIDKHGLPERTESTITTRQELFEALEEIRDRGFAYNDSEEIEGLRVIGAPIIAPKGTVLGALSLSGPVSRMREDRYHEKLPELVMRRSNIIEVNVNMSRKSGDV